MEIGHVLKELRLKKDLTQDELADLVGTTAANISRIENGKHGASGDLLNSISYIFGFKVYEIIAMAEGVKLPESEDRFSSDEIKIIQKYRTMNSEQKTLFLDIAQTFSKFSK